jgi:peptidoglycan hydrolase CwlO-like protein
MISEQLVERDASLKQALLDKSELDHGKMNAENESQTLKTKLEECRAELREARSDNEKIECMRTSLQKSLATVESCLKEREKEFSSSIEKQEYAISDLQQKNSVLSLKCERLRACVRKLTAKCDEWEGFLERHSQFVHQLENKYESSRQQVRQLAAVSIASRLLRLSLCTFRPYISATLLNQMYSTEKAKALSLQHELDLAARELQKIGS